MSCWLAWHVEVACLDRITCCAISHSAWLGIFVWHGGGFEIGAFRALMVVAGAVAIQGFGTTTSTFFYGVEYNQLMKGVEYHLRVVDTFPFN